MDDVERSENYIRQLVDVSDRLSGNYHLKVGKDIRTYVLAYNTNHTM